jgi:hypothetical protein
MQEIIMYKGRGSTVYVCTKFNENPAVGSEDTKG